MVESDQFQNYFLQQQIAQAEDSKRSNGGNLHEAQVYIFGNRLSGKVEDRDARKLRT